MVFVLSVYAALLAPIAALGGVACGIVWWARRYTLFAIALSVTCVALGYKSSTADLDPGLADNALFMASHLLATGLWAVFTAAMSQLLPQELPSGRRMWLQKRARLVQ
jgi:hypothetical protein